MARSTRCVLSRTAASARPTRTVLGIDDEETSTSTSTGVASMPTRVYDASFDSMGGPKYGTQGRSDRRGKLEDLATSAQVDMSLPSIVRAMLSLTFFCPFAIAFAVARVPISLRIAAVPTRSTSQITRHPRASTRLGLVRKLTVESGRTSLHYMHPD